MSSRPLVQIAFIPKSIVCKKHNCPPFIVFSALPEIAQLQNQLRSNYENNSIIGVEWRNFILFLFGFWEFVEVFKRLITIFVFWIRLLFLLMA